MSIQEAIQTYANYLLSLISPSAEEKKNTGPAITLEHATTAAKYWGTFLPGVQDICFSDINKHSKLDITKAMSVLHQIAHEKPITQEQHEKFIEILAQKILTKDFYRGSIQLGDMSSYEPAKEIEEAINEAGLEISAFGIMPYKTQMNLYPDGHTTINYETVDLSQNPAVCSKTEYYTELYSEKLKQLNSTMNPYYPEIPDLSAKLAIYSLALKCQNSEYNARYSKKKLVEYDLYPWNLEDSAAAVEALCGLLPDPDEL